METKPIMIVLTIISIVAIFLGPVFAVMVGQYLQNRKKKYDAKINLFFTIMSYRYNPVHQDFVRALNLIDVIFQDNHKILDCWHKYHENLHKTNEINLPMTVQRSFLDLVQAMSNSLGYKGLKQTDIDKTYSPKIYGQKELLDQGLRDNLDAFLKSGNEFFEKSKDQPENKEQYSPLS